MQIPLESKKSQYSTTHAGECSTTLKKYGQTTIDHSSHSILTLLNTPYPYSWKSFSMFDSLKTHLPADVEGLHLHATNPEGTARSRRCEAGWWTIYSIHKEKKIDVILQIIMYLIYMIIWKLLDMPISNLQYPNILQLECGEPHRSTKWRFPKVIFPKEPVKAWLSTLKCCFRPP